jgi:hypothetical protein
MLTYTVLGSSALNPCLLIHNFLLPFDENLKDLLIVRIESTPKNSLTES